MTNQPNLMEHEWRLILELLEREGRDLHPEIRHSATTSLRERLQARLKTVDQLAELIRDALPKR